MDKQRLLPERAKVRTCARCHMALTEAWHGFFDLHLTVPEGLPQEDQDRLVNLVKDVARPLCWECLDDAVRLLIEWRDHKGD